MHSIRPLVAALLRAFAITAFSARLAQSQSAPDIVRGRVTDDSAHRVVGATVMITRGPDRLTQQTTTDSTVVPTRP